MTLEQIKEAIYALSYSGDLEITVAGRGIKLTGQAEADTRQYLLDRLVATRAELEAAEPKNE